MADPLIFSIVVPTYNEEQDIRRALDALVCLAYPHREIIVVDDSTDRTPDIVREYAVRGVRLVRPDVRRGPAAARNLGIREATGDVLVILQADDFPPKDFLDRILPHYERGADYVLVESQVTNEEKLFPRFVEAQHHYVEDGQTWINWTEGFSCRRDAALAVGLFPADYPIPFLAGDDGTFANALESHGYRKVIDKSIVVFHAAPETFRDFWFSRHIRGGGAVLIKHYIEGKGRLRVLLWVVMRTVYTLGMTVSGHPVRALRIAIRSPRGLWDVVPFWYANVVQDIATRVGEWAVLWKLWRMAKWTRGAGEAQVRTSS
jgi:glycosyltransferase involved in cell wall biosynthesis